MESAVEFPRSAAAPKELHPWQPAFAPSEQQFLMNNSTLDFKEIAGQKLTPEQNRYLEGFFAGLRQRGVAFKDIEPIPAASAAVAVAAAPGTFALPENATNEEKLKQELHPLDAYPLLLEDAEANRAPEKQNIYRYKWNGLFWLAPNTDGYMARLRIPGGFLKSYQLREVAKLCQELASGFTDITTRANFQVRVIKPKDTPEFLRRIQAVGLHSRGAGADNVRNITASPTAGIDPFELIDVSPLIDQLAQLIINDRSLYNLPRKFNIAFDGGGAVSVLEDTNDIGFKAVQIGEVPVGHSLHGKVQPGIYFRMKLAGVTGHKRFASDAGVLVPTKDAVKLALAIVRVFIANGDRTDRKKARLKFLLEAWGIDKLLAEVEKQFGSPLLRDPLDANGKSAIEITRQLPLVPHPHLGVHPQKQKGLYYVGASVPVGRMQAKQMIRLAEIAELYGSGDLRLTVWQNLIIPNIPEALVGTVKKALAKVGFPSETSAIRGGLVACTGNSYCKFASSDTKGHAIQLANYLEKKLTLDQPINIHLTGCPNSCAQHYVGDIGLLGTKVKVSGETLEGYHVFVGGGFGENQGLGRQVFAGVSIEQLKPTLEKMLSVYLRKRQPGESFSNFTRRHDLNSLQQIFGD
jgi:ferredoxin-nitrite reductase